MPKIVDEKMREAIRQRIIREAAREFARHGFDQASITMIAEQANIGKGTIYLYFENKRELFLAMLRHIAQAHLAEVCAALAPEGSLQERLERLFLAFVHLTEEESDSFNVYMSALYGVNRAFKSEAVPLLDEYLTVIAQILEESRMRGEIQCDHIEVAALMVLSLTESYILSARVLGQAEQTIRQQAKLVTQLILNGLGAPFS